MTKTKVAASPAANLLACPTPSSSTPSPAPSTSPSPSTSRPSVPASDTVRARPLRVLKNIVDKLDQNQREMAGKFQAIRAEWEAAIRDLQVAEQEEGPAETSSVSAAPILISREAAEQRRSVGSEPSSAGAMLDGPDSAKKTTAVAPKKRGRKAEGGGQKQDPDRNAVERQLRLLAKLQKNLSDKTGVDPPPSAGPDNGQGWQASKGWPASKGYQQK